MVLRLTGEGKTPPGEKLDLSRRYPASAGIGRGRGAIASATINIGTETSIAWSYSHRRHRAMEALRRLGVTPDENPPARPARVLQEIFLGQRAGPLQWERQIAPEAQKKAREGWQNARGGSISHRSDHPKAEEGKLEFRFMWPSNGKLSASFKSWRAAPKNNPALIGEPGRWQDGHPSEGSGAADYRKATSPRR